jgi:hypothetical protein
MNSRFYIQAAYEQECVISINVASRSKSRIHTRRKSQAVMEMEPEMPDRASRTVNSGSIFMMRAVPKSTKPCT